MVVIIINKKLILFQEINKYYFLKNLIILEVLIIIMQCLKMENYLNNIKYLQ